MIQEISSEEVHRLKEAGKSVLLVDVRTPAEYELVRASYALNIPLDRFETFSDQTLPIPVAANRDQAIYFICKAGPRSAKAAMIAEQHGYSNVYNVLGGTIGWIENDLPVDSGNFHSR